MNNGSQAVMNLLMQNTIAPVKYGEKYPCGAILFQLGNVYSVCVDK